MKVNDLMVGDLVIYGGLYTKVIYIGQKISLYDGKGTEFTIDPCHIEPIPLTEEILVKNGFVYREEEETCATQAFHHWQLNGHWFALNYTQYFRKEKKDDMPRFDIAGIAFNYVHQLQHLLRLCGIEKELIID